MGISVVHKNSNVHRFFKVLTSKIAFLLLIPHFNPSLKDTKGIDMESRNRKLDSHVHPCICYCPQIVIFLVISVNPKCIVDAHYCGASQNPNFSHL